MEYQLVYDVAVAGYRHWTYPGFGLLFVAIGGAQILYRRSHPGSTAWKRVFPYVYFYFASISTLIVFVGTYTEYRHLVTSLKEGRYVVVEGVVTQFVPMPYHGHADERFEVNGRRYRYSDYSLSAGFNNSQAHGGPIHAGVHVRIADVDGRIARLEIGR